MKPRTEALVLAALICAVSLALQSPASDWALYFRPAAVEFVTLGNPYTVPGFPSPTWALIPLLPLVLLPVRIGVAVLAALSVGVYYYAARRLGASIIVAGVMVANPMYLVHHLTNPNIDWLVIVGFLLPPSLPGALLLLAKPQIGAGVALYDALRKPRPYLAAAGAFALSVFMYGPYVLGWGGIGGGHNLSMYPYSLPFGVALLAVSLWRKERGLALIAAPLLSPYVGYYSLPVALLGLLPRHGRIAAALSLGVMVVMVGWGVMTR